MGHLFNAPAPAGLGNPNDLDDDCSPNCFQNTDPFVNTRADIYRFGTDWAPDPNLAWEFNTRSGRQLAWEKTADFPVTRYVWVVRDGSVPNPAGDTPVPANANWALVLLIISFMAIGGTVLLRRP